MNLICSLPEVADDVISGEVRHYASANLWVVFFRVVFEKYDICRLCNVKVGPLEPCFRGQEQKCLTGCNIENEALE